MSNEHLPLGLVPFISVDPVLNRAAILEAMRLLYTCSQFDGSHHKAWCLDQIARALTGDKYEDFVKYARDGEEGPETYGWDEGIEP